MVSSIFPKTWKKILEGSLKFSSMSVKAALLDNNYIFDKDTEFFDTGVVNTSNPANQELSGVTDYARKSVTLSFDSFSTSAGGSVVLIPDIIYGNLGGAVNGTIKNIFLFNDTGDDLTSHAIAVFTVPIAGITSGIPVLISSDAAGQISFQNPTQV